MKSRIRFPLLLGLAGIVIFLGFLFAGGDPAGGTQAAQAAGPENGPTVTALPTQPAGWVTLMSEDFEGVFPSTGWHIGREGDPYLWGVSTCHPHSGSYSIGSHMGGSLGSLFTCEDEYPLNYVTTLSYGPMDLSDCTGLRLNFSHLTQLELIDDLLSVGYSNDGGASWSVLSWGGDSIKHCDGWCDWTLTQASYPIALCGEPSVYLLFRFQSDWMDGGFGSWVDDISLEAYYGDLPPEGEKIYIPLVVR